MSLFHMMGWRLPQVLGWCVAVILFPLGASLGAEVTFESRFRDNSGEVRTRIHQPPPFQPFVSEVLRGGQRARHVRLQIRGVEQLSLIAEGVPNYKSAHANWADAKLIAPDGGVTYLSDLKPVRVYQPYGTLQRDRSHRGGPIRIAGKHFERGLGTHAYSDLRYALEGKYEWFEALVGVDATAGTEGHVRFIVTDRFDADPSRHLGPIQASKVRPQPADVSHQRPVNTTSLRLAITDLIASFPEKYAGGKEYLGRLDALESSLAADGLTPEHREDLETLRRQALLANPLLDFDRLLLVRRRPVSGNADRTIGWSLGFPRSSAGNSALPSGIYDNEIAVLSPVSPEGRLTAVYMPEGNRFVGDVDLHFDARKMLFSMRDAQGRWRIWEIGVDGDNLRQVSRGDQPDVDEYDACYLPDGRIIFCSSACFQCVPCNGSDVAVLYRMDADGGNVRQLCFEQDHDFNPVILPSGRVMYLRWEYSGLPHSNSRILFSMNPDGTAQTEYYGSNSYWPNGVFAARPIPGHVGMFCGIVAGHHGSHREGELVLFDSGRGRQEAAGAVQRIPGHGKRVEPVVADELTANSWPKFCHPYPLSDKYFLATCKLNGSSPWDICLVDVFDNIVPLYHLDGHALLEPIPLRTTPKPPVVPDRVDLSRRDAVVHLADIYRGDGLKGLPRGTVKRLRLFTYHFAYQGGGGLLGVVGLDGPWDVKRVLGTVPVHPDGSALFRIPANTPISLQPLDAEGKALQVMRSWLVGMPGETVSCVGCHESQSTTPIAYDAVATRDEPAEITPWYGQPRNFSYQREVQPVIDKHCTACHDGSPSSETGQPLADLRGRCLTSDYKSHIAGNGGGVGGRSFSVGYFELSRYVRRAGIESDIHMLHPMEYHADATQLVQMLAKGHHNVRLDAEAWDRLITWIDLNCPYHGTWTEAGRNPGGQRERRRELRKLYAGVAEDPEGLCEQPSPSAEPELPKPDSSAPNQPVSCPSWPFDRAEAARRQKVAAMATSQVVDLGDGVSMELVLIPAGEFVMGSLLGCDDEKPSSRVKIPHAFWMGKYEVTNRQFARFDPAHDSRFESKNGYQFGVTGFALNEPDQPVVRVSWDRAMAFCRWLSERTGRQFTLPAEARWEYACRAGTDSSMFYGEADDDFSTVANMADATLSRFATDPYTIHRPLAGYSKYDDWIPKEPRFDDRALVTVAVGSYRPNAWGLCDMHGNVAEWTRSAYRPYPYHAADGREDDVSTDRRVVRGGSWRDLPKQCTASYRLSYEKYRPVFNVGFRVATSPDTK